MSTSIPPLAATPPELKERRVGLLDRLAGLARDALGAIEDHLRAMVDGADDLPSYGPSPGELLLMVVRGLGASLRRLAAISARVAAGTPPRRRGAASALPAASARPDPWRLPGFPLPPLLSLARLGVPGARALAERLSALMAEPGMAELLEAEPAARRAAAPIARALGRPLPRRRRPAAEPAAAEPAVTPARREGARAAPRPPVPPRPEPGLAQRPPGAPPPVPDPRAAAPPRAGLRASLLSSASGAPRLAFAR